jgi:DNA-directed RNA polymerase subunit beta'
LSAYNKGRVKDTDIIRVGKAETTIGRLKIESVLPERLRETGKKKISDMRVYDKKMVKTILTSVAKHDEKRSGEVSGGLMHLGNQYSTNLGFSVGLDDFKVINKKARDRMVAAAEEQAAKIRDNKKLTKKEQDSRIVDLYMSINEELDKLNMQELQRNPTNIYRMVISGSRGDPDQLKQIVSTPALVMDAKSRIVPHLIPKSYSEGLDLASYWTGLHGARKGLIQKVQGVKDPGYLSKQILNSTMNVLVTENDCGTKQGIWLNLDDPDILDRRLAMGAKLGPKRIGSNVLVTPNLIAMARKTKKKSLFVRSPLRCEAEHGVCKHCLGLAAGGKGYDIGDNVGVIAGQAIGEPSTQLSMRVFHTGGLAKGKGAKSKDMFHRLEQLLRMPRKVTNAAPLALSDGKVTKIEKAPQGGEFIYVNNLKHYVPTAQSRTVNLHDTVHRGIPLSDGNVDPRQLLPLRGIRAVQDYIAAELQRVLQTAVPIRRRNVEVVVKSMTNVTRVEDPGSHPDWVVGDMRPTSAVHAYNKKARKPVIHTPVLKGVDILPLEMQEDWMARLNFQRLNSTLTQAAREGWSTNIHGFHPVPAAAAAVEFGEGKKVLGKEWRGQY